MKVPSSLLKTMLATTSGLAVTTAAVGVAKGVTAPDATPQTPGLSASPLKTKPKAKATAKSKATATPAPRPTPPISQDYCPPCGRG